MSEELFKKLPYRLINKPFTAEKTSDIYHEVEYEYEGKVWSGLLPKYLEKQGLELDDEAFTKSVEDNYEHLNPSKRAQWIAESDAQWAKKDETYKVLNALYSGDWECRVHGPVPKVNPQPSARIKSLKMKGYIIGSKRKHCPICGQSTMHDILLMLPKIADRFAHGNELRKPMSNLLKERIKKLLQHLEVAFDVKRSPVEIIIDHKFPSQRWNEPESDNPNNMSDTAISAKFQLLSNQTNLWKSRCCDTCVKTNKRGSFMGIKWYYEGDEEWRGATKYDENGCIGCPWYDMATWKQKLAEKL